MNKAVSYCLLSCFLTIVVALAVTCPDVLSDRNEFLKGFVNHEIVAVNGIMLTIILASASQIHLLLNEIEEKKGTEIFRRTRHELQTSAYWLIWLFLILILIVTLKSPISFNNHIQALISGLALSVLFCSALILVDITKLIFGIRPDLP